MFPWKMIFRSFSALVLFMTGGFAAGQELPLPPFDSNPPEVSAPAAPAVDDSTTTTTTTTEAPVDDTTTTTTAPEAPPVVVDPPLVEPVPVPMPPADDPTTPTDPTAPAAPIVVPVPDPDTPPPATPADPDAPTVCAEADAAACGPAPAADNTHAARVQRCVDWWRSLAQAFADNNRPEWSARANQIADRCDEMITRWEQWEQRWRERQARQDRVKGDHNGDGHFDNGRGRGDRDRDDDRDGRRGQPRAEKASRHRAGR